MKRIFTAIVMSLFALSCSSMSAGIGAQGVPDRIVARQAPPTAEPAPSNADFVERCIADASSDARKLRAIGDLKIYARTADFDGNRIEDIAVLVTTDSEPLKGGLLVCLNGDAKSRSVFGPVFDPVTALTSFDKDNFITSEWEVILGSESSKIALGPDRKSRIAGRNKGDVIAFFHEGGGVFIFWDGNAFRIVEGG